MRWLIVLLLPLLAGCASTISVDRTEALLAYAEVRAVYAVAWDRIAVRCAGKWETSADCITAKHIATEAEVVNLRVQEAARRQDTVDWTAVIRLMGKLAGFFL